MLKGSALGHMQCARYLDKVKKRFQAAVGWRQAEGDRAAWVASVMGPAMHGPRPTPYQYASRDMRLATASRRESGSTGSMASFAVAR